MGIKTFMKGWGETGLGGGRSGPAMQSQRPQPIPGKLWSEYCLSELLSIGPKTGELLSPCLDQLSPESHRQVCVLGQCGCMHVRQPGKDCQLRKGSLLAEFSTAEAGSSFEGS